MRKPPLHRSLTPLRAVELLRDLDTHSRELNGGLIALAVGNPRDARREHVRAAIVRNRRRRARQRDI